jgi:HK97 family phage portal protein
VSFALAIKQFFTCRAQANLAPPDGSTAWGGWGGWWPVVRESFPGAWQQNVVVSPQLAISYHAIFACITLIANDVGKLRFKLMEQVGKIWEETTSPAFSPFLNRPNHYQNPVQFRETWTTSKLRAGNTYALKQRDDRGVVIAAFVLDPGRVKPLVAPDGAVFYELHQDNLADLQQDTVIVPQSEIFHDRMNCLFHPLVGLSPIFACGLPATQGLAAQENSTAFFQNMSRPGGILIAPGPISQAKATAMQTLWNSGFSGSNSGKVAVIGDGMKYQPLAMTAQEAQMLEQLKWTGEAVCACFHVPPFKISLGPMPTYQNAQVLNQIYYSDCLQSIIEQMETCIDYGLTLDMPKEGRRLATELDLDMLLRMDTQTQISTLKEGVTGALYAPNEAREKLNLGPVQGGAEPYLQQQNYSLEALARRDSAPPSPPIASPTTPQPAPDGEEEQDVRAALDSAWRKEVDRVRQFGIGLRPTSRGIGPWRGEHNVNKASGSDQHL